MTKKQVIVNFENQKWICDFIDVEENQDGITEDYVYKAAIAYYIKRYDDVRNSMGILKFLLPAIMHISFME